MAVRDKVFDPDEAADVVQDTFVKAMQKLDNLREPSRFRPWLLQIARNAAVDVRRFRTRVGDLPDDEAQGLPSATAGADEVIELGELVDLLGDSVALLGPRDATTLSLVAHLGLSSSEVATALGMNPNQAKVAMFRARQRLRDAVSLRVLVRAEGAGCAVFEGLVGDDDLVSAATHLKGCPDCARAAEREVALYDTSGGEDAPLS